MNVIDQIYNGCAMLPGQTTTDCETWEGFDQMERHRLKTSLYRIRVALGEICPAPTDASAADNAYMAGYEDESE